MNQPTPSFDYAVHSDYLIHWTGKEIDKQYQPDWYKEYDSFKWAKIKAVIDPYLERLRNIVRYGLWMTEESNRTIKIGDRTIALPATPQCCFTELKLSESRRHAREYGRLGIGVKRKFMFERFGRPLVYYGFGDQWHQDKFLEACESDFNDKRLLHFFKPMNQEKGSLTYDYYFESEWRILYFKSLEERGLIKDPRKSENTKEHEYFKSLPPEDQDKLKYLIPLDSWFTMIIHPSVHTKNLVHWDASNEISEEIRRIKTNPADRVNRIDGEGLQEGPIRGNWPMQVELDACRNF